MESCEIWSKNTGTSAGAGSGAGEMKDKSIPNSRLSLIPFLGYCYYPRLCLDLRMMENREKNREPPDGKWRGGGFTRTKPALN